MQREISEKGRGSLLCLHMGTYYVVRKGRRWPNPTFFGRTESFCRCCHCNRRMERYQEEQTHKCGDCGREKNVLETIHFCQNCNYVLDTTGGNA